MVAFLQFIAGFGFQIRLLEHFFRIRGISEDTIRVGKITGSTIREFPGDYRVFGMKRPPPATPPPVTLPGPTGYQVSGFRWERADFSQLSPFET